MEKKEALVGAKYNINKNIRSAEEVAENLVYPERKKENDKSKPEDASENSVDSSKKKDDKSKNKAENIRYIASLKKAKKKVMEEIKDEIIEEDFSILPLICVMDGANYLWQIFGEIFQKVTNKVLILDIIHVVEYIWLIAHVKYKEGSDEAKKYVYEKLLFILQGKVASYYYGTPNRIEDRKIK